MSKKDSHFFAYMARMKNIGRWGLMRNTRSENVQEHSLQVAMIAHALAIIKNTRYGGNVNPDRIMTLSVYHEASEVITGDLPTPIKYFDPNIKTAYKNIESIANCKLLKMIPEDLQSAYEPLINQADNEEHVLMKAADRIAAYLKCIEEENAGNHEFVMAKKAILKTIKKIDLPEIRDFMDEFIGSFYLTLDELN